MRPLLSKAPASWSHSKRFAQQVTWTTLGACEHFRQLQNAIGMPGLMSVSGIVYLVGAGPGHAGLFTLRGKEVLGRAEVVIYDGLVNLALLRLAPPTAEIIFGGKHDRTRCVTQEELNALLVAKGREGKRVVRLKGGDPFVFGRGGEEAEVLAAAGIQFEVVPGVSSMYSVPCYAGIPLTHREHASSVTIVTGHDAPLLEGAGGGPIPPRELENTPTPRTDRKSVG